MRAAALTAGVLAVAAAAWLAWTRDERQVRALVHELADAVSVPAPDPELARIGRMAAIQRGVAAGVVVIDARNVTIVSGREPLLALAGQASTHGPRRVEIQGLEVTLDEGRQHAVAAGMASITRPGGAAEADVAEFRLELARGEGGWAVTRVEAVSALDR